MLQDEIIRLHVVGASNEQEDQDIKLEVRDAILGAVKKITAGVVSKEEAMQKIQAQLPYLEDIANEVLEQKDKLHRAVVSLKQEEFPTRVYDTFSLPAGVYDSLRITIGDGDGRNWWCVVFPQLCLPAVSEGVEVVATEAGFSEGLSKSLTGEPGYEVRFYLLDLVGRIRNLVSTER